MVTFYLLLVFIWKLILLSLQIVGPALYGFVYARTVATFPRAIFFFTVATIVISLFLLLLVRLPSAVEKNIVDLESSATGNAEDSLQTQPLDDDASSGGSDVRP